MKRTLSMWVLLLSLFTASARAEFLQIDMSIFGMD
jgi:hypothetical protein